MKDHFSDWEDSLGMKTEEENWISGDSNATPDNMRTATHGDVCRNANAMTNARGDVESNNIPPPPLLGLAPSMTDTTHTHTHTTTTLPAEYYYAAPHDGCHGITPPPGQLQSSSEKTDELLGAILRTHQLVELQGSQIKEISTRLGDLSLRVAELHSAFLSSSVNSVIVAGGTSAINSRGQLIPPLSSRNAVPPSPGGAAASPNHNSNASTAEANEQRRKLLEERAIEQAKRDEAERVRLESERRKRENEERIKLEEAAKRLAEEKKKKEILEEKRKNILSQLIPDGHSGGKGSLFGDSSSERGGLFDD